MHAVKNKWPSVVRVLLQHGARFKKVYVPGKSLLFLYACEIGNVKIIEAFITAGCDPNEKNAIGLSALVLSTCNLQSEAARFLITQGANPNEKDLWEKKIKPKFMKDYQKFQS